MGCWHLYDCWIVICSLNSVIRSLNNQALLRNSLDPPTLFALGLLFKPYSYFFNITFAFITRYFSVILSTIAESSDYPF